jgi:hypothetical protein
MGEQGTNRKRYGAKLDGRHRMRMVIGRDGKLLEGDEVGLVGMVTDNSDRSPNIRDRQPKTGCYIWP